MKSEKVGNRTSDSSCDKNKSIKGKNCDFYILCFYYFCKKSTNTYIEFV